MSEQDQAGREHFVWLPQADEVVHRSLAESGYLTLCGETLGHQVVQSLGWPNIGWSCPRCRTISKRLKKRV